MYSFKNSILEDINDAHLVIGHCGKTIKVLSIKLIKTFCFLHQKGAGTILDVLRSKKSLIVVINQDLMDNHQIELAQELSKQNYLESCFIDKLNSKILSFDKTKLKPLPEPNPNHFLDFLNNLIQKI